jgi:hypothetical protein
VEQLVYKERKGLQVLPPVLKVQQEFKEFRVIQEFKE